MPQYNIGERVDRIEDREVTGATIIAIQETINETINETIVELQYDEGGSGWWPTTSIKPIGT